MKKQTSINLIKLLDKDDTLIYLKLKKREFYNGKLIKRRRYHHHQS